MQSCHSHRAGVAIRRQRPFTDARPARAHLFANTIQTDRTVYCVAVNCENSCKSPAAPDARAANPECHDAPLRHCRRIALQLLAGAAAALSAAPVQPASAIPDDFVTLPSGIKILTIREGEGAQPAAGDTVAVHWAGFTKGYQGKRIDNTSIRDEPYEFKLGAGQAIKAFELAVENMRAGGIVRVEVPGELPELGYPIDRGQRFTGEMFSQDYKIYKYRYGPQPAELGGQRALDFVLDNQTLRDFNRTLLFDIKLLAVRKPRA